MRISFLGDTMCEPLLLARSQNANKQYNFEKSFFLIKKLLARSDYVVCNLETPIAGSDAQYTQNLFSFNAPIEFAQALKLLGVNLVLTANNHCLDRGENGAKKTLENLTAIGLNHTGMFMRDDTQNYYISNICGYKVAFLSYTYGTNYLQNKELLSNNGPIKINMLSDYQTPPGIKPQLPTNNPLKKALLKIIPHETRIKIKKKLGLTYYHSYQDDYYEEEKVILPLTEMAQTILRAKNEADIVILCPHMGGQFNLKPGAFSELVADIALRCGCDAIIASHPHVVQEARVINGSPCFFSLGNFAMSPNSAYLLSENLPNYGIVVHLDYPDIDLTSPLKDNETALAPAVSFSIVRSIEKENDVLQVWPLLDLYEMADTPLQEQILSDANQIVKAVLKKDAADCLIQNEYFLG